MAINGYRVYSLQASDTRELACDKFMKVDNTPPYPPGFMDLFLIPKKWKKNSSTWRATLVTG